MLVLLFYINIDYRIFLLCCRYSSPFLPPSPLSVAFARVLVVPVFGNGYGLTALGYYDVNFAGYGVHYHLIIGAC